MPPLDRLPAMVITACVLIAIPGPSVVFIVSRSVALGRRAGLATVVGNAAGVYVQAVLVAFGLGTIVERSDTVFSAIKLAGACYLALLGLRTLLHRRALATAVDAAVEPKSRRRITREGFVVGLTNPKAAVIFTAVLPQFVDRERGWVPLQMLVLGLIFALIAVVSDGTWALAAGTARTWLARSRRRLELIAGAGGMTMVALGVRFAVTGRKD